MSSAARPEGKVIIQFTRQVGKYLTGDITGYNRADADELIGKGVAVPYSAPKKSADEDEGDEGTKRRRVRS